MIQLDDGRRILLGTRFIMIGTVIPFVLYVVGRYTFDRAAAVRALLWTILALAAYSAAVSIMQFTGPTDLVWPRYIVDGCPGLGRPGRGHLQPAGRQRNGARARLRDRDVADEPAQRTGVAEVCGIRDRRRLRLRHLSDPHPGSLAQRRGRAHHRCTSG